jgi:hypothetical protein
LDPEDLGDMLLLKVAWFCRTTLCYIP